MREFRTLTSSLPMPLLFPLIDPSESWYQGEIGFYDFYIIPLAKKLDQCGVFGVSSDEFLNYAKENRGEWEKKGRDIVANYLEKYNKPGSQKADEEQDDQEQNWQTKEEQEQTPDNEEAQHSGEYGRPSSDLNESPEYGTPNGEPYNYPDYQQQQGDNYNYPDYEGQYNSEQYDYSNYQGQDNGEQHNYQNYSSPYNDEPYNYPDQGR